MPTSYPFVITEVNVEIEEEIKKYFLGLRKYDGFVRIGPKGYFFPKTRNIKEQMSSIYNMPVRPSDIFVATFPRSEKGTFIPRLAFWIEALLEAKDLLGTTWTQELVWLIANDLDYNTARSKHLIERYATLGSYFVNASDEMSRIEEYKQRRCAHLEKLERMITPPTEVLARTTSPRFIKNHIPLSMLPPTLLYTARVIYVARDPRDAAVSLYHLSRLLTTFDFIGDFKTFWNFFKRGLIVRSPYFPQVKEAWKKRDHPNMLFLFYEDLSNNLPKTIRKISKFLKKQFTDDEITELCEHLHFKNFKHNQSVNLDFLMEFDAISYDAEPFIRKGKIGGWRDYFDEEMMKEAKIWIEDNLRDTDLIFPQD